MLPGGIPALVNMPLPSDPTITFAGSGSRAPRPVLTWLTVFAVFAWDHAWGTKQQVATPAATLTTARDIPMRLALR